MLVGQAVLEHLVEAEKAELRLVGIPKEKPEHYQLCKISKSVILCIGICPPSEPEKKCRENGSKEPAAQHDHESIEPTTPDDLAVREEKGPKQTVHLRSVQGIHYYLGEVLRYKKKYNKEVIIDEAIGDQKKLFALTTNSKDADTPIISVDYNNETWYVPAKVKGGRTKTVLALVLQLLGLHKTSIELPTTTTVTTVGGGS